MSFKWLQPQGFWGFIGVTLAVMLASLATWQLFWEPFVLLTQAEAMDVYMFMMQLQSIAAACLPTSLT